MKKKPKYYVAQIGGNFTTTPINNKRPDLATSMGIDKITPPTPPQPTNTNNIGGDNYYKFNIPNIYLDKGTWMDYANYGMMGVTAIANKINTAKNTQDELNQWLDATQPHYTTDANTEGLNHNPIYTQYGGYGQEECDDCSQEMKNGGHWIQGAIKHPGRCADPGSEDCPKGSPQYNLAMTFKKHHGFHKQAGGYSGAHLVDQVPEGYAFAGEDQGRRYYNKNLSSTLPTATSTGTQGGQQYQDFLIKQLNSGISPQELVNKKYISPSQVDNYNQYYTPMRDTVYTQPTSPSKQIQPKDNPANGFYGENLFDTNQHAIGQVRYTTRRSTGQADSGTLNSAEQVAQFMYLDKMGKVDPTRGYYEVPGTVFSNQFTGGTRTMRTFDGLDQYKMQYGGMPTTKGLPKGMKGYANVEAEQGEAYQDNQGNIMQVDDGAPTHEQGGVALPDVHRVLENTSNIRKDKTSQMLKLSPKDIESITGLKTNKSMSHAEAMIKSDKNNDKMRQKLVDNIELAASSKDDLDSYAEESVKLNLDHFRFIPSKQQVFDQLFDHQEAIKAANGIADSGNQSKYGGNIKAAGGYDNQPLQDLEEVNPPDKTGKWAGDRFVTLNPQTGKLEPNWNAMTDYSSPEAYAKAVGYTGNPKDIRAMQQWVGKKYPELVSKYHGTPNQGGFGMPRANTPFDGKLGVRWQAIANNISQPRPLTPSLVTAQPIPRETPQINLDKIPVPGEKTPFTLKTNPQSRFYEPLRWYDLASGLSSYVGSMDRIAEKYNPAEINQLRYKQLDPTVALQQNQNDYNAALQTTENMAGENTGAAMANIANLAASKYSLNNQVIGNYDNQNAQIKNNETLYNTQAKDKQSLIDQQAREVFEEKVLTARAKQDEQRQVAADNLYKTIAENHALNRNGNLMMKFSRAFDQYGNYNGYAPTFTANPTLGINPWTIPPTKGTSGAAGGVQGLKQGTNYYNRKTGKTYYFNGTSLVPRD